MSLQSLNDKSIQDFLGEDVGKHYNSRRNYMQAIRLEGRILSHPLQHSIQIRTQIKTTDTTCEIVAVKEFDSSS